MTRAQQTHDIFTVYRVWGMVVLLEWLAGMFSHGYPGWKPLELAGTLQL